MLPQGHEYVVKGSSLVVARDASEGTMGNGGADVGSNQSPEKVIRARAVSRASILAFQTSTMQMHARLMFFLSSMILRTEHRDIGPEIPLDYIN